MTLIAREISLGKHRCKVEFNNNRMAYDTNAHLTIILRVYFRRMNAHDFASYTSQAQADLLRARNWQSDSAFNHFKRNFIRQSTERFSDKFWLTHNRAHNGNFTNLEPWINSNLVIHRNADSYLSWLRCKFHIQEVHHQNNAHLTVHVANIRRNFNSFINATGNSDMVVFNHADRTRRIEIHPYVNVNPHGSPVYVEDNTSTIGVFNQLQIPHEISHALNLRHSGQQPDIELSQPEYKICRVNANDRVCYGTILEHASLTTGAGNEISWHLARPWRFALEQISGIGADNWYIQRGMQRPIRFTPF